MKKLMAILILIVAGTLFMGFQDQWVDKVMTERIADRLNNVALEQFKDTLTVAICGAGSPLPDPQRSGSCALIIAGDQVLMVDAGNGVSQLAKMGIPVGWLDDVFLTHFHSDHINGLGELMTQRWAGSGKDIPIKIHGPVGTKTIVAGFNMAYGPDRSYREAHHTTQIMPPSGGFSAAQEFTVPSVNGQIILDNKGLKVTAFPVNHSPVDPAVGYKFEYKGHSIVFSGDTAKSSVVEKFAKGADVLVHEALSKSIVGLITSVAKEQRKPRIAKITEDILDYHTSPVEAAEVADASGVPFLLFSHIVPQLPIGNLQKRFLDGVDDVYSGDFAIAQDGSFVSIHLKDGRITQGQLID